MGDMIYPIILGAVQGLTEFLPVSSSAHLIIASWFVDGKSLPLALNIALHLGTLSAVLLYFRNDWLAITRGGLRFFSHRNPREPSFFLLISLIIGSIPAGLIGIIWKDEIETVLHHPIFTIIPLVVVGFLLWWVDDKSESTRSMEDITLKDAFIIGCAQALALIPGTSRSGITIIGGRFLHFDRDSAARYSFLLGTPAMLGAALLSYEELLHSYTDPVFYMGFISSFVVGLLAIHLLLKFIRNYGFLLFFIYRVILAAVLSVLVL
jgi:undecaprenyl-diphosphatase